MTSALTPAGSTRAWRRLRALVLHRDAGTCHWCGRPALHVDHVTPRARGGTDDLANLVASCTGCNLSRGAGPRTTQPSRSW